MARHTAKRVYSVSISRIRMETYEKVKLKLSKNYSDINFYPAVIHSTLYVLNIPKCITIICSVKFAIEIYLNKD